jgi:S1-C subfamily serine protease
VHKLKPRGAAAIGLIFLFGILVSVGSVHAADASNVSAPALAGRILPDFVSLAKKIGPSVVNIATTQGSRPAQRGPSQFGGDERFNEFWERFFGGQLPR